MNNIKIAYREKNGKTGMFGLDLNDLPENDRNIDSIRAIVNCEVEDAAVILVEVPKGNCRDNNEAA
jgi:hypothetical protein